MLFAAMVLLFFLRAIRMTAIITLAIPLCVMMTIVALYFMGWSLNMMTMMGLMVGVGLVVDNAIVILENIYRIREKGEKPKSAAVLGASEVAMAITMATLTTVVVFLPLMLMSTRDNSASQAMAAEMGITLWFEVFADRAYDNAGMLVNRKLPGAVHHDSDRVADQALRLARGEALTTHDGGTLTLQADTLCVHGDNAASILAVQRIRQSLEAITP